MFNRIRNFVQELGTGDDRNETPDHRHRVQIAAAVILLEAASANYDCSDEELDHVLDSVGDHFDLSGDEATELVELARAERERNIDLFHFTRILNEHLERDDKLEVLESVWEIIYLDGKMDQYEDHFARKIGSLLRLSHRDLIDLKLRVRDRMRHSST